MANRPSYDTGAVMDAPDPTVRRANSKIQLGIRPNDRELGRLDERMRLEGQNQQTGGSAQATLSRAQDPADAYNRGRNSVVRPVMSSGTTGAEPTSPTKTGLRRSPISNDASTEQKIADNAQGAHMSADGGPATWNVPKLVRSGQGFAMPGEWDKSGAAPSINIGGKSYAATAAQAGAPSANVAGTNFTPTATQPQQSEAANPLTGAEPGIAQTFGQPPQAKQIPSVGAVVPVPVTPTAAAVAPTPVPTTPVKYAWYDPNNPNRGAANQEAVKAALTTGAQKVAGAVGTAARAVGGAARSVGQTGLAIAARANPMNYRSKQKPGEGILNFDPTGAAAERGPQSLPSAESLTGSAPQSGFAQPTASFTNPESAKIYSRIARNLFRPNPALSPTVGPRTPMRRNLGSIGSMA